MTFLRFALAVLVCGLALVLPYRARTAYFRIVAYAIRLPYVSFGRLAKYLTEKSASTP